MKKIFFSLLAIAALASCAKTEAVYTEDNSEIKIKPATALATKANYLTAIDGTAYPTEENFDVYAYWADEEAGSTFTEGTVYLGLNNTAVEFAYKGLYWGGAATTYYWPKNGSLRFAAYSPSNVDMAHDLATDTYTVENYTQPATTDATWDLLVAPTSESYTAMTAAENVSVVFEHALSWITVKVVAKDAEAAKAFDIKKVTINDVVNVANLEAVMTEAKTEDKMQWELSETTVNYEVFTGSQPVTETATVIETTANGTLVIPQPTTTITVDYTQNALEGTPALNGQSVTVDLVLDANDSPWKAGKHYVYTLVFGLDEILINPDVVDWEDVVVNEVEVGTTNVYSVEQLQDALAQGGKIVLQENLEATSFKVTKDAVLDLNGKTITGADNLTSSYSLFEVQPDVAFTVNGPGTLTVTATENREWNAFSSVLSNQRGTLVVNEGVVVKHLGGTDMAYGIDNLTNTGAQPAVTIVNGATVESTYRAIRQFLNSATGSNELYVKSGSTITGTNKSIWAQDANTKANPGILEVEEGAVLNGDIYLFVAAGSTEWPLEASIPESTLNNGATVTSKNVPAGYAVALVDGVYTVVKGATGVATADELAAALTADEANISVILSGDLTYDVAAWENDAMGGASTEVITIDLNGNTLTFNQTDSDWNNVVTKAGKLVIKNGHITNAGHNDGPWNRHDINFACPVELVNVTSDKAIALKSDGTLKNVTINDPNTSDTYAIWVQPKGQTVILEGCTIDMLACTDGRGLKIDNQYLDAAEEKVVTLKVSDTVFKTEEKSAILVKSTVGANITLNNVNISEVAADSTNPVWVDDATADYAHLVTVSGGTVIVEP